MTQAKEEAEAEARRQLEAIAADSSKTEEQRQKARKALKAQKVRGMWELQQRLGFWEHAYARSA